MEKRVQNNKLMSIGESADYLGVSIDTLRRWEKKGKIYSYRSPGDHRYFSKDDLDKLFGKKYQHDKPKVKSESRKIVSRIIDDTINQEIKDVFNEEVERITFPYAPSVYPTLKIKEDQIVDKPTREIKIPEVKLIRIIHTKEELETTNNQKIAERSEEVTTSILTPANIEKKPESESKDRIIIEDRSKETNKKIIKNNFIIYSVATLLILIVIATIFFLIGISSQEMLSPIP